MLTDGIRTYAINRIHFKARQLLGRHGFAESDFEDIRQELLTHVLRRLSKFNRARADIRVFITTLVDRRIADLIAHHEAKCRDHRRVECSLDDWVPDEGDGGEGDTWTTFGKTITEDRGRVHRGVAKPSLQEQAELAIDVETVLGRLSDGDRELCLLLQVKTPLEISREKGIARSSIYERIAAIRRKFVEAGIDRSF